MPNQPETLRRDDRESGIALFVIFAGSFAIGVVLIGFAVLLITYATFVG